MQMVSFKDKYISTTGRALDPTSKKIELSDDAYAIGELLVEIAFRLRRMKNG